MEADEGQAGCFDQRAIRVLLRGASVPTLPSNRFRRERSVLQHFGSGILAILFSGSVLPTMRQCLPGANTQRPTRSEGN
jgi:hypothetical protein